MPDADIHARKHTVRGFDEDLAELTGKIVDHGRLGRAAARRCDRGPGRARLRARPSRSIEDDDRIDELEEQIDQLVIRLLAMRQPMAVDLRVIAMALKISNDLERMGDYATSIAKRVRRINVQPAAQAVRSPSR